MKRIHWLFIITFFPFGITILSAQQYSSKVFDAKTKNPIPYATVQYGEYEGVITNEEGLFSFYLGENKTLPDSIYISSMGYAKTGFSTEMLQDSIIYVEPKAIELSSVYLFNKELSVDEILEKMEDGLEKNHGRSYLKKRFFLRQSYHDQLKRMDVDFKKSTIKELDKKLIDSTVSVIPRKSDYYTETLGDLYLDGSEKAENKMTIIKAAELYDKNNEISAEALQERFEKILQKNVKQDSYLKIKSGWFSTKVQVDSILQSEDAVDEETQEPERTNFLPNRKRTVKNMHQRMWSKKTTLDVIKKRKRYEFELKGYTDIGSQGVYILAFKPEGRADFEGTLFVNVEDFAIMRVDYHNVKVLRNFKLLGFSMRRHTYKGTTVFEKAPSGVYDLKFATFTFGQTFGVDRPLKIVEKNKNVRGRRKQNELKVDVNFVNENRIKYELVIYGTEPTSASILSAVKEDSSIKPTYLPRYNPEFWNGYNIMEPNQAIREFEALSNTSEGTK